MRSTTLLLALIWTSLLPGACSDEGGGGGGGSSDQGSVASDDGALPADAAPGLDQGAAEDGGSAQDAGATPDGGGEADGGGGHDAESPHDADPERDTAPGRDADPGWDAGSVDGGGAQDVGSSADAASADGGSPGPLPGFGLLTGQCGLIGPEELLSPEPFWFVSAIDFGADPYDDADFELLSPGGQQIIEDGNAGGSSILSEVFAYEVLHRCDGAELLETETNIHYVRPGSITDILVQLDGERVGVSVTRAVGWPRDAPYSVDDALNILEAKLAGILESTANVAPNHAWNKQILSIIAYAPEHVDSLEAAWAALEPALKADTIVVVTVSEGEDAFLY